MELNKLIGFDYRKGCFTIGTHDVKGNKLEASAYNQADVDAFLAKMASGSPDDHELLAAAIVEPIEQVVPYLEMYNTFYMDNTYGELEDNAIPVEDTVAIAFETHQDSAVLFVRSGFTWTRPEFQTFDAGIEVPWDALKKAGWNFLERQMRRTAEALARKRDEVARNVFIAGIPASHEYIVTGGALTKAGVDAVLKDQADIGFPVQKALVNPGTIMDMASFTWGGTGFQIAPEDAKTLLRTLHLLDYGGVQWFTNPHVSTTEVLFAGAPSQVGWHQLRGSMKSASDVDIRNKVDLHAMYDAEHAWYVGNTWTLARIRISA